MRKQRMDEQRDRSHHACQQQEPGWDPRAPLAQVRKQGWDQGRERREVKIVMDADERSEPRQQPADVDLLVGEGDERQQAVDRGHQDEGGVSEPGGEEEWWLPGHLPAARASRLARTCASSGFSSTSLLYCRSSSA